MNFQPTEEQLERCDHMESFARSELNGSVNERDSFDPQLWQKCADECVLGLFVPEELGGSGLSTVSTVLALEALGYGCEDNGLTLSLNGQIWSVQEPLLKFGTNEQQRKYLPMLCRGEMLAAHGMTEAESGSDAFALKSTAIRDGDSYMLTGEKCLVGLAPVCDLVLVFASTNPAA
ncbi:MAG: acyl-CoA dehydrogenase family protein, partial [Verrucomicrobiota bacterium]